MNSVIDCAARVLELALKIKRPLADDTSEAKLGDEKLPNHMHLTSLQAWAQNFE